MRYINKTQRIYYFIIKILPPILISILFIIWPFLVIKKTIFVDSPDLNVLPLGLYSNFFTYYRLLFLFIITCFLFFIFLLKCIFIKNRNILTIPNLFLVFILVWIILSAFLSPYKEAFYGMYDRTRGAIAYIICFVFAFLVSQLIINKKQKKIIVLSFIICTFILSIISILQFSGYDIFLKYPFNLLLGSQKGLIIKSETNITAAGMYNKNVLGGFLSIAIVVMIYTFFKLKRMKFSIILFLIIITAWFSLITTSTRGAWIVIILFLAFYIIFIRKNIKKYFIVLISFIFIFILLDFLTDHSYFKRLYETLIASLILISFISILILIYYKIAKNKSKFYMFLSIFCIFLIILFIFCTIAPFRENVKIMRAGSGRIYMFWRVGELILKKPIFGTGPEVLIFNLDVEDIYRYKVLKTQIIDKAHSFYYGLAVDSGIPALLMLIFLSSMILNVLWNDKRNFTSHLVFWGLAAYFIQGLSFDAFICTDIILFTLFGLGIAKLNKKINLNFNLK